MKVNLIYVTVGSKDEAKMIGRSLVESRLAACVNIIDNMNAIYRWEGELQENQEVILIAKTAETRVPKVVERVKKLHTYDCPCIVSLPLTGGNQSFLDWIVDEVTQTNLIEKPV
ncbi:MAG: divalent-cation tolerance protein CutA [Desulfobacterales bacterium]|jgi:periplasmic divalent cation tolerance protein|nr:divalent-cation tolerance protein CutA [Desulfobacterales bacterium]